VPFTVNILPNRFHTSVLLVLAVSWSLVHAQEAPPSTSYPMRLTPDRALAFITAADRDLPYLPGEVLVKFKRGVSRTGQQRALQALRSQPGIGELRWVRDIAILRDASEANAEILAAQLREQPEVAYAEPNRLYRTHLTPKDPSFDASQWNLKVIDVPRAWDINPGATANVTVAVIDSGVTTVNSSFTFQSWNGTAVAPLSVPFKVSPDLAATRLVKSKDFIYWDGPVLDMDGHGTHVASTIGEDTNNDLAVAGIAYNASIMPLKACIGFWEVQFTMSESGYQGLVPADSGGCAEDAILSALVYAADNGAKVINMSLGGEAPSAAIREALTYAVGKGAFVSISVGNAYEEGNPVEYPAADAAGINGAVAVGAVGPSLRRSYYSGTGDHVELAAPGGDFRALGADGLVWQVSLSSSDADPHTTLTPRFDRYFEVGLEGTSMAAPHVAGIAALLVAQGVTRPSTIEALLKATALDLGTPGRDKEYGLGVVHARRALLGFGVVK
jgi:serine protease